MSISRYRLLLSVLVLVAFLLPGERGDFGRLPRIRHVASWLAALRFVGSRWA